jgi:hypothetical protein
MYGCRFSMIKYLRPCLTRTQQPPITIMPLPKSIKGLAGVREFIANLHTRFASAATVIGPACAPLFDEVAGKLQGVLGGLPKDEIAATHAGWALRERGVRCESHI